MGAKYNVQLMSRSSSTRAKPGKSPRFCAISCVTNRTTEPRFKLQPNLAPPGSYFCIVDRDFKGTTHERIEPDSDPDFNSGKVKEDSPKVKKGRGSKKRKVELSDADDDDAARPKTRKRRSDVLAKIGGKKTTKAKGEHAMGRRVALSSGGKNPLLEFFGVAQPTSFNLLYALTILE